MPIPNGKLTPPPSVVSSSPADRAKAVEDALPLMYLMLFEQFRDDIESVQRAQVYLEHAKSRLTSASDDDKQAAFLHGLTVDGAAENLRFAAERLGRKIAAWIDTRELTGDPKP